MFRTRDFILVFVSVIFLLVAIGSTLIYRGSRSPVSMEISYSSESDTTYTAEVTTNETPSRADRLATMRDKIASGQALSLAAPVIESEADETLETVATLEDDTDTESPVTGVQLCANHSAYSGVWTPQGVKFAVTEGARLIYRDGVTLDELGLPNKDVLLQLPMYALPSKNKATCLPSDVVGIAQDGSLIRNDEAGMYRVFGASTLVGYALDGFPIYGASDSPTDSCGGTVVAGQYRYYLSAERDTVINCFAVNPVSL